MNKQRDLINEVLQSRGRRHLRGKRISIVWRRLDPLIKALHAHHRIKGIDAASKRELARYYPIAIVAASEGYFRLVYTQLIDSDPTILERCQQFKDLKIDIRALTAIHGKKTTVGELIAHQLKHSGLDDINHNMSTLLGSDFIGQLKKQQLLPTRPDFTVDSFSGTLFSSVRQVFEKRHIYCHEIATKDVISFNLLRPIVVMFGLFIIATDKLLTTHFKEPTSG